MFNTQLLGCLSVISKEVKLLALVLAGWSASQERVDSEVEPRAQSPAIAAARMRECASLPGYPPYSTRQFTGSQKKGKNIVKLVRVVRPSCSSKANRARARA